MIYPCEEFLNDKYEIKPLLWDSEYFGINCTRVTLYQRIDLEDLDKIKARIEPSDFVSIVNMNNDDYNNLLIGKYTDSFLADINIQYEKIIGSGVLYPEVHIQNNFMLNNNILLITDQAFKYSKFFSDPELYRRGGAKVYHNWINNSFGKMDKYFLAYTINKEIVAYTLFSFNPDLGKATIELFAVAPNFSRRGIGKKMIQTLENYLYEFEIKELVVGTQLNNIPSNNFYHQMGFKECGRHSCFHLWNKNVTAES